MVVFLSSGLLFFFIFILLVLFYGYWWNFSRCLGEVRCWVSSYECGFLSQRSFENYFSSTYLLLLVFFVLFDLEVSLLLNVPFQGVLYKNFCYYYFFVLLLSFGFFVEIERGYVNWNF